MNWKTVARLGSRVIRRELREGIYLRSGSNRTWPSDIRATLTERCNYRCGYCHHWRQDSYPYEMSLEEWQRALLSIKSYVGSYTVQFIGGEPMIWTGFFELARFCHDNKIDWGAITNGSVLSAASVAKIISAKPLNIDISIDSRNSATHDWGRGVRGSFDHVARGMTRLVVARDTDGQSFPVRIKPTVHRHNMGELCDLVEWASTMRGVVVDISPVRLWRAEEISEFYPDTPDEFSMLHATVDKLISLKMKGAPIETSITKMRAMIPHFMGDTVFHANQECRVGLRSIDIRPDGHVNHCWKFARIGNLRRQSAQEIWEAPAREAVVRDTVSCELVRGNCGTACTSHRTLPQELSRGIQLMGWKR